eukprot:6214034-Pleurochrysis_carterae.AAC.1
MQSLQPSIVTPAPSPAPIDHSSITDPTTTAQPSSVAQPPTITQPIASTSGPPSRRLRSTGHVPDPCGLLAQCGGIVVNVRARAARRDSARGTDERRDAADARRDGQPQACNSRANRRHTPPPYSCGCLEYRILLRPSPRKQEKQQNLN